MPFNSVNFALFLPTVFVLYWFVANRSLRAQNLLLLVSSYVFYASWDYRFLLLLFFSTFLGFFAGKKIFEAGAEQAQKYWLWLGIGFNLGILGIFKYYDFFVESFIDALLLFGIHREPWTLSLILPVGISFYTFRGISYLLDISRKRYAPARDFIDFAVFVSFFPLLVAGPIERASHLLPQIQTERRFEFSKGADGLRQILWGLFKKLVIADGCAQFVNIIFEGASGYSGSTLFLGAILFAFQIYTDFSGYSDIALGTSRLFGIELLPNFAFPYFSRDVSEFWRRWHISLSTWFRDYLYYPLERRRMPGIGRELNILIVFLFTGLWHGANWTFVAWGILNALYLILLRFVNYKPGQSAVVAQGRLLPSLKELFQMSLTFALTVFAWIFFRAESIGAALRYIASMFSRSLLKSPEVKPVTILVLLVIFLVVEWIGRERPYALQSVSSFSRPVRWAIYYVIVFVTFYFAGSEQAFIYFQF